MMTAVVLICVQRSAVDEVAQRLLSLDGVDEVFSVAGQYDLVAILRTQTNEQIAELITSKIRDISDITRTETLMAFRAFPKKDLDAMFSIGNKEK